MNKIISKNRKAFFNYEVISSIEAGISLLGTEVKSVRKGEVNLKGSYIIVDGDQLVIKGMHIKEYFEGNYNNHLAKRDRILLVHKKQINQFMGNLSQNQGMTLIPLEMYFVRKWIKIKVGLCKGKKLYDKRRSLKEKQGKREVEIAMKKLVKN